jgi:hypothetical protein
MTIGTSLVDRGQHNWNIGRDMFSKSLRREVIFLICLKAVALTLIYCAFVAPVTRPEPDGGTVAAHLLHGSRN